MILSLKHKYLLLSTNKTGTSSMDRALEGEWDEEEIRRNLLQGPVFRKNPQRREKIKRRHWNRMRALKHAKADWLKENFEHLAPGHCWEDFFKFCFVRDPIERLYSVYNYHIQKRHEHYPEAVATGSFHNWLKMGWTGSAKKSQRSFVLDEEGRRIVDFVGKYESLAEDWNTAFRKMGRNAPELPHHEGTRTDHVSAYSVMNRETIDVIEANEVWRGDIDYFGYRELVAERFDAMRS